MQGTRLVMVRVRLEDVEAALGLTDGGLSSRVDHSWDEVVAAGLAVVEYSVFYGPETDDVTYSEQSIAQVTANLDASGLWWEMSGNGVVSGGGAGFSRYVVRPRGSDDARQSLTIFAMDDEDFRRRWDQYASTDSPSLPLDAFDVEITRPTDE